MLVWTKGASIYGDEVLRMVRPGELVLATAIRGAGDVSRDNVRSGWWEDKLRHGYSTM